MPSPKDPVKREEWLRKCTESNQKNAQCPEWRRNNRERGQRLAQDPDWQRRNKEGNQSKNKDFYKTPEWIYNHKKGCRKRYQKQEYRYNHKKIMRELREDPIWRCKLKEGLIGGFWYGNVRYTDPPKYCELWCPDLWHRIDEAQNYQSILSGKTRFDNGGRALSRHHVYWQPKACCEWDEDMHGYCAMINIGTRKKPNQIKYYIPGDPNKFVLLTASEHQMIKKDKSKWIKIFEDLIETKLGGICYLQKDCA